MAKFLVGAIRAKSDKKPDWGGSAGLFLIGFALSADPGFLDDRVTVAADLFHLVKQSRETWRALM
jgi:hypothetical protein